jgi:hypothetical protein
MIRGEAGALPQERNRNARKWFKSTVAFYSGTIESVRTNVPTFERRSFALTQADGSRTRLNEHQDVIVRAPIGTDSDFVPVGVVSKDYALIQHHEVIDVVLRALAASNISADDVDANLEITEYGERIALSVHLPKRYAFDPGDGHPMALRLECLNSVDGSTGFRALMGWFRFVCSNGLIIGVTRSDVRRRHVGDLALDDVAAVLQSGLSECEAEKRNFQLWRRTVVESDRLKNWIDDDLRKGWGFKAATRAFHIASTGRDVTIVGPYKGHVPTTIPVTAGESVPGAPGRCGNLFDLSQVLAWIARDRADVQEQLSWREQISGILKPFIPSGQLEMNL